MKKIIYSLCAAGAMLLAASCAKEYIDGASLQAGKVEMTFNISNDGTRAALASDLKVNFENGDSIAIYDGISTTPNKFVVENADGTSAVIRGNVSEGATTFTAVYPFTAAYGYKTDTVTVTVPSSQLIPAGKNIDPAALVCYAKADKGQPLALKNAVALIKLTLTNSGIKTVKIKPNSDVIVGQEQISLVSSEAATSGSSTLTVSTVETADSTRAAGTYYAAVLPVEITGGFAVVVDKGTGYAYKISDKASSIKRNAVINFGNVDETPFPMTINTKAELLAFARCSKFFATGTEIKLGSDIDLESAQWPNPVFYGNFDGQNHRVYNFITKNNVELESVGFLATLGDGTNGSTLKNLCVGSKDYNFDTKEGTYDGVSKITFDCNTTETSYKYPGLIAYVHVNSTVENVANFVNIEVTSNVCCKHRTGGICGTMKAGATIKDCINFGNVTDNSTCNVANTIWGVGGISGWFDGNNDKIMNCINKGNVTSNSPYTTYLGGIVAATASNLTGAIVDGCKNYGKITHKGSCSTNTISGGIIGRIYSTTFTMSNCENHGDISYTTTAESVIAGATQMGGIAGYTNVATSFNNCSNSGNLTFGEFTSTKQVEIGGVIGRNVGKAANFTNCHNTGNITNYASTSVDDGITLGGILGWGTQTTGLTDCSSKCNITNYGKSTGSGATHVSGIYGYNQSIPVIKNCSFTGKITAEETEGGTASSYGGFCAWTKQKNFNADGVTIDATIEIKKAAANTSVGGLYGFLCSTAAGTSKNVKVKCNITGASATKCGIFVGNNSGATAITTIGSVETPANVSGSFNGTALTAENYTSFLYGSGCLTDKLAINSSFQTE